MKRPILIMGPAQGRAPPLRGDIPMVLMESPRGLNDPSLGAFAEVLAKADWVGLMGKPVDFTLKFGSAFAAGCEVVAIDRARAVVLAPADPAWLREVREAVDFRPPEWERLPTVQGLRSLQPILDAHPHSVFISDGGEIGQWAQACLRAPHRVINGVAGSIGAALPFAVAARLAQPEAPIIAVMGDGTFGFHPAEIDTAVRYGLPFVVVVGNDARWNAEYQIQLRDYRRTIGTELLPTRYDQVARAFGGYGEHVEAASELSAAVRRAIASGLPAVIDFTIEGLPAPTVRRG